MRTGLIRTTILAAGIAAATFAASSTAYAGTGGGQQELEWITATCATGAVTQAVADDDGDLLVHGEVTQCGDHVPGSQAAFVFFDPASERATVQRSNMWYYSQSGTSSGSVLRRRTAGTVGVCVMGSFTWRLACAEINVAANGAVTLRPIATTDPLVSADVDRQVYNSDDPECGSCF